MEKQKVNVMYDENGKAIRVQMDFDLYQWLVDQVPQGEQAFSSAH
jgi:hypothetical protein